MWKSTSSIVGKTSGLDDQPMVLQQEINDFLHVAQNRKQQKLVPRINKVDFTKPMPETEFALCLQLQIYNKDFVDGWPLSSMTSIASMSLASISLERDRGKFTLVMRIPKKYPHAAPDISCVTGGEYIPPQLKQGPTFVMPWIQQGWPSTYSLLHFAEDLCTALGAPENISTTSFLSEQKVFPLDSSHIGSRTSQRVLDHSKASCGSNEHATDLLMLHDEPAKPSPFQGGTAKLATATPTPTNPFDSGPHTSVTNVTALNQSNGGDVSGSAKRGSPHPTHDLLGMHHQLTPSAHGHSNGAPVVDLLGIDLGIQPSPPRAMQRSNDRSGDSGHLAIQTTTLGNTSPQGNVQSPRGLEMRYQSNECCIKCKFKDEARRFVFEKTMTFQQLQDAIVRLFQFPPATIVTLAYLDSDGDKCGLSSDEELRAALSHYPDTLILQADIKPGEHSKKAESLPPSPLLPAQPKAEDSILREIKIEDVKLEKCIGVGSSCKVYKAIWRGTEVAIKKFTSQNADTVNKEFRHEVQMMAHLGCHPCIVLLLAVCSTPKSIVFEYLPFSLFEQINGSQDPSKKIPPFPNTWQKRLQMIMDVARGLQFLHSFNIVHRDLKSLNLLITDEGRVKLADFGIAKLAQDEFMTRCCGTYQWMAPEVIVSQSYSVSADIYSFGVVMWEICEASVPFADTPAALVAMAVIQENKRPTISPNIPTPLKELISKCWHKEATVRPDAATIVNDLTKFLQASQTPT
ncbi:TKL protein kinase [Aphanomyces invadans]|uniref:TKL protein kinase n=1 Tax=Aphanomyces invadans TaxID=157072 RepID=A0A024U7R4_9STRA|nr:TKL protein kinase [Aphanomyces invadans]ETW02456.1 TKL protein kinase [Aphanomyces invadans]|eukprot:XP_008869061.1 TKL protein kinase [Aphanomyces invadans]